jgi:flagellar biosynthesis/type III secretory pathway chaperone
VNFAHALDRMESLLEEERAAIRRIDVDRVVALSEEKQAIMQAVAACDYQSERALHSRFRSIVMRMRENGVLLAHARNCVRDVLQLVTSPAATYGATGSLAPTATGRRLSVTL